MSFLELVAALALASAVNTIVQAIVARYALKRVDAALSAAASLAAQLERLLPAKGVPGPGERDRVPVAPGDLAESPGPGAPL